MLKTRLPLFFFLLFFLQQVTAYPVIFSNILSESVVNNVQQHFQQIRHSKKQLTEFFTNFPKGGDLHNHFMGSTPPSILLQEGVARDLCVHNNTFIPCSPGQISALNVSENALLEQAFKRAMTVTELEIPELDRHAKFFSIFAKMMALYDGLPVLFMNNFRQRAAEESLFYIETTTYWNELKGPNQLFAMLEGLPPLLPLTSASMTEFMQQLTSLTAFKDQISKASKTFQQVLEDSDRALYCNTPDADAGCKVTVRFIHESLRTNPPEKVFAQLIFAFYLAQQHLESDNPLVLGINIVGAEDNYIARRDYELHMEMISFLKNSGQYPLASITLHAGEMTKQVGSFRETSHSLTEAITTVAPKRIGHGASLAEQYCAILSSAFQTCSEQLASLMNQYNMALEAPYVSNELLLNTDKDTHPLPLYLKYNVPVVLATDDPGILKTDMTTQFVDTAYLYDAITFTQLLTITRNSLEYSFLPGKSLWQHSSTGKPNYSQRVEACEQLDSDSCKAYVAGNLKAKEQVDHEIRLAAFISKYNGSYEMQTQKERQVL